MSELIDNRARRVATLKEIIQHLHKGKATEAVKGQYWRAKEDSCNTSGNCHVETETGSESKTPARICWGCNKYRSGDDLRRRNGTIRTQHPVELFGPLWLEWELGGNSRLIRASEAQLTQIRHRPIDESASNRRNAFWELLRLAISSEDAG